MGKLNSIITDRLKSFSYAFNGLKLLFRNEPNSRIHAVSALLAILLGIWLHLSTSEWTTIIIVIALVIAAELFNTSIEKLCDHVTPQRDDHIKFVKDTAAAGVLVCSIGAFIVGAIIYLPKIYDLIKSQL